MEKRKHVSTMGTKEKHMLRKIVKQNKFVFTEHCIKRTMQRRVLVTDIMRTIRGGNIVEVHMIDNSLRVLLRGRPNRNDKCPCVVLNIMNNEVVTVYHNYKYNHHQYSKRTLYTRDLDICSLIKPYLKKYN